MKRSILSPQIVNQLVFATVAGSQAGEFIGRLTRAKFYVTRIDSRGGFLHEATVSLLIGLDRKRLPHFLELIRECCQTHRKLIPTPVEALLPEAPAMMIEAEVGGATIYVFDVERFEQM
jgi:uncharacterized protein YaaQ